MGSKSLLLLLLTTCLLQTSMSYPSSYPSQNNDMYFSHDDFQNNIDDSLPLKVQSPKFSLYPKELIPNSLKNIPRAGILQPFLEKVMKMMMKMHVLNPELMDKEMEIIGDGPGNPSEEFAEILSRWDMRTGSQIGTANIFNILVHNKDHESRKQTSAEILAQLRKINPAFEDIRPYMAMMSKKFPPTPSPYFPDGYGYLHAEDTPYGVKYSVRRVQPEENQELNQEENQQEYQEFLNQGERQEEYQDENQVPPEEDVEDDFNLATEETEDYVNLPSRSDKSDEDDGFLLGTSGSYLETTMRKRLEKDDDELPPKSLNSPKHGLPIGPGYRDNIRVPVPRPPRYLVPPTHEFRKLHY